MSLLNVHDLKDAGAAAVVLGPDSNRVHVDGIEALGGGWSVGILAWRRLKMPYVLLLADTRERVKRSAPLVMMARDEEALLEAVSMACDRMAGKVCLWNVDEDLTRVLDALAEDTATAGNA